MELQSLERLEAQVNRFLDDYKRMKAENQELAERIDIMTRELNSERAAGAAVRAELEEARRMARDPEKEHRIRAKVDELLAKLERF